MKKMSLQWRLTCIITVYIAVICGCLTMLVYKNGVYYIDSLKETVDARGDEKTDDADEIYISIPEDNWDAFANDFSVQVYNNKTDYRKNSLIISAVLALLGGVATYFISGHALRPIREFSDKIEEVQAQNLADSRLDENKVKELNQMSVSYNKMLGRLSDAFEIQRQFTANAAHELRTPLALMQVQLDSYNSGQHPGNDADTVQTIKMVTEQNDRLSKMVKTLLDMSELQTVGRDETIMVDALVDEVLADLEPLAREKDVELNGNCEAITIVGSDILIYRLVYNLVENAIKYNHPGGQVTVSASRKEKHVCLSVADTGNGIPEELRERVFEPFFRVDKSRSRALGGVGLGLLAGVTLRDDLLLLLVQSSQPGRALEPGLLAFAALGGIHLQNGLHQVVDIFHAMHLTLWELYLGWVPCLPLRGGQGAFLYINRYTQFSGSAVL